MRYLLLLSFVLLAGCANQAHRPDGQPGVTLLNDDTIYFTGGIEDEYTAVISKLLEQHSDTVNTLIISSRGGEVFAGIELGRLVHEHQLKVIVRGDCASSCANYVITSSPDVVVESGSILGWHGGAMQDYYSPFEGVPKEYLLEWLRKEQELFELVGVEPAVPVLGMMPGLEEQRSTPLYSYDQATLKRLGLNVTFEDNVQTVEASDGEIAVQVFEISADELAELIEVNNTGIQERLAKESTHVQ